MGKQALWTAHRPQARILTPSHSSLHAPSCDRHRLGRGAADTRIRQPYLCVTISVCCMKSTPTLQGWAEVTVLCPFSGSS